MNIKNITNQRVIKALKELTRAGDTQSILKAYALLHAWGKLVQQTSIDVEQLRHLIKEICALILGK